MSWTSERARVASLTRSRPANDPDLVAARRDLRYERLAAYIEKTVSEAPLLTDEQFDQLAVLLRRGQQQLTAAASVNPATKLGFAEPGGDAA